MSNSDLESNTPEKSADVQIEHANTEFNYLVGWRLYTITAGIGLSLFLINFEVTIVSTALVSITNELQDFQRASWIVSAYLVTYTGGLAIWAKVSDFIGRKTACVVCSLIFVAFSAGCGASQSMVQIIVCRAFQGIGSSGLYSVSLLMVYELVPPPKYPVYTSITMVSYILSLVLGPLFGGLITSRSSWRWVFLLNVPAGALAAGVLLLVVPNDFPYQNLDRPRPKRSLKAVDFLGGVLMIAALALTITGLEEAASNLYWTSPSTLAPLCVSAVVWSAFMASQWNSSRARSPVEPIFPWHFLGNSVVMGIITTSFLTGTVSVTCMVLLPFRAQTVLGSAPLDAGIKLLPFALAMPVGYVVVASLTKRIRTPSLYYGLVGQVLQIIGLALLSVITPSQTAWSGIYGFQVLLGFGLGFSFATSMLLAPIVVERKDLSVMSGSIVQFRFLGSAIAVAVTAAVGNSWTQNELSGIISAEQFSGILRSAEEIKSLPPDLEQAVRVVFLQGFNLQMRILLGFAVAGVFTVLLLWKKPQIRFA
ncbi:major facilitator superfamily domain-containing protein [Hypoxylon sp. FL1284]|nr:major facilitator superfamily domain-containing protein [Hypoxylon sp. FL1284]